MSSIWRNMERYSCNKSEVLNRLRKYEWSTRNTASRPSRLWDLAPKQSGEVIQSDRTVAKKSKGHHRYLMEGIADQQSQLVSILAGGRNSNLIKKQSKIKSEVSWSVKAWKTITGEQSHRSRPVVVKVRQLVSEPLHVLWLQAGGILDRIVSNYTNNPDNRTMQKNIK